ncbi:tRNA glutamyl-Q(34) synthetase GluQRS [Wenzhouxiangella sp. AB-CW3]|nr:tRNA glutamyl-Q(34) synthetase GluQRS [Wenzhouxiangella sp. AB-CW3]
MRTYIGRFAPSPTGPLHFGSLVAAVGSWLQARHQQGRWLLRIEDIDPPRVVQGSAEQQIATLTRFGLKADGPVQYQRQFHDRHAMALERLLALGLAYPCGCSRRDLPADGIYPGTCRNGIPDGRTGRSIRMRTDRASTIEIHDRVQGDISEHPGQRTGDFVIRRADGLIAYQLAVVVDDHASGVTEVVRGADLIGSTARQVHVYQALGWQSPDWMHLPLIVDEHGRKLSKSERDDPIETRPDGEAMRLALRALGHEPSPVRKTLSGMLDWALENWNPERIPRGPVAIGTQPGH